MTAPSICNHAFNVNATAFNGNGTLRAMTLSFLLKVWSSAGVGMGPLSFQHRAIPPPPNPSMVDLHRTWSGPRRMRCPTVVRSGSRYERCSGSNQ